MKKLSLSILTVLCAVCFMFGVGLMTSVSNVSADVAGGAPVLSETKIMRSVNNDKMLLATAIMNFDDVYEIGYDITNDVEPTIAEKARFYTSIQTGSKNWTAEDIFGSEFSDAGLIVWEIPFELGEAYEFKAYAIYGDRNEQGQLVASNHKVTPENSTVKQFFEVTFKTHDGSEVLSQKVYAAGAEVLAPEKGTTYTLDGDKFAVFYDEMKNSGVTTANESATYKVFSEFCAPDGMGKGKFYIYGDAGPETPTEDKFISLGAHRTFGNLTEVYNNERVLYRERAAGTGLDHASNLTFYSAPNSIMTELYIPFYILQGDSLDLGMHAYTMSYNPTLPVKYIDADGNEVNKEDIQNETWYTAVYTLTGATQKLGEKYKFVLSNGSSVTTKAYIRAPYFGLADGVSVSDFDNIKDDLGRGFMATKDNSHVLNYVDNGELVSQITFGSGAYTPFSTEIAEEYIVAQAEGGKVLRFDVKFDGGWTTYNGYVAGISYAMSNTIRGNRRYVRFYDANGTEIAYGSLQQGVWYKWVFDIDTIKSDVCEQTILTGEYAGLSPRIYANEEGETISIKNVEIVAKSSENV